LIMSLLCHYLSVLVSTCHSLSKVGVVQDLIIGRWWLREVLEKKRLYYREVFRKGLIRKENFNEFFVQQKCSEKNF
jgi:hypothetical protein